MTEALTEEHIQALLVLRKAGIRKAPHPEILMTIAGTLGAYSLACSDGLGGLAITDSGKYFLRNKFLFCEATGCDGILWRKDVVAPMYAVQTVQRDAAAGYQFMLCPQCGKRNVLDPLALNKKAFRVTDVTDPPKQGPPSSR